jgi:hypothetical protein
MRPPNHYYKVFKYGMSIKAILRQQATRAKRSTGTQTYQQA